MNERAFRPKAYVKEGCPYSFKALLFLAEARLLDRVEVVRCDPHAPDFEHIRQTLARATGKPVTFPTLEAEPGRYLSDSDRLIDHLAQAHGVDPAALPALAFYRRSIFPQLDALHREH